ncbi:IclR family transcriptional regulator [Actinocorallia sp. A-T 12471]|uniref:IclR family transcriptional regulator n=1 Tax=Actinocorallia sp. A-T 12471 TaxID=3089813 RepID=UPI0029CFDEFB|nr:IclR family transcriptional regulator [Actinocorallia sp. A-T 12471]MDX6740383.1 IclR family transcriptional regulator [Actinocorallia sp. A-T 12471]
MRNKPPYAISSVDHALQLAALLQHEGPLRVTDAAERLEVSVSTAHRLLAMLVYRDFAEQLPDRRYAPGKLLRPTPLTEAPVALLRRLALPRLRDLVDRTHETANLMVPAGDEVRIIATVECDQLLRVGDRVGRTLPLHLASAGKAILAALPPDEVAALYPDSYESLSRELATIRRRGFAINDQRTEPGLTALGMAVHSPTGPPIAGISLSIPTARFTPTTLPTLTTALTTATTHLETALSTEPPAPE